MTTQEYCIFSNQSAGIWDRNKAWNTWWNSCLETAHATHMENVTCGNRRFVCLPSTCSICILNMRSKSDDTSDEIRLFKFVIKPISDKYALEPWLVPYWLESLIMWWILS